MKVGLAKPVLSSESDQPPSYVAARSGVDGPSGAAVSMVTISAGEAALVLPAVSVALAVMLCVPSASDETTML